MPRKAFLQDLERLKTSRIPNIIDLIQRKELGVISIVYFSDHLPTGTITIQAEIPEVSDYPREHYCFLYTNSDENPPPEVSTALGSLSPSLQGKPLLQIITDVAKTLERVLNQDLHDLSADVDERYEDEDSEIETADDDDEIFADDPRPTTQITLAADNGQSKIPGRSMATERVRSDLRAAKRAGFKVGILGDLDAGGFVCISIRVTKLGISEEAMKAWGLRRKQYLILMIRVQEGYQTLEEVAEMPYLIGRTEMRVALCERYKPTIDDALKAFTQVSASQESAAAASLKAAHEMDVQGNTTANLEPLFIGRPLNDLLRERFPNIVKYRLEYAYGWTGAENFFQEAQGKSVHNIDTTSERYYVADNTNRRTPPRIVTADTIVDTINGLHLSLPLVAMQFLLRHVVRCTEFCLVCHCHVEDTFEALKPYVCSKPLCLYQYLALGFGPSIEWEIVTQPYVVDLLVSFCYAQARGGRLRDFPTGIDIKIPMLPQLSSAVLQQGYRAGLHSNAVKPKKSDPKLKYEKSFTARLDRVKSELLVQNGTAWPARNGDWLAVQSKLIQGTVHYRVKDISRCPNIKLDGTGVWVPQRQAPNNHQISRDQSKDTEASKGSTIPNEESTIEVDVFLYDKSLDDLPADHKQNCVTMLLDTLPSVLKLREHLLGRAHGQDPSLRTRCPQLCESALNLLRWIIASNRSCIMQVDKLADKYHVPNKTFSGAGITEDRVSGMEGFMQFRFAQGAPDKEQRFVDCVKEVSARTKKSHPTIFAWHGSPLANWHSIVREGLHFKETLHGRAYGHGVYMARDADISLGYAGVGIAGSSDTAGWPNSDLQVQTTLSLNEVVNSPDDYVHKTPFYVVSQLDWIQTRYLFVKTALQTDSKTVTSCVSYVQDPTAVVTGGNQSTVVTIPITAVSKSRRPVTSTDPQQNETDKVGKASFIDQQSIENAQDDADSVVSDMADREFLELDTEEEFMSADDDVFPLSNGPVKRARETDATPTKLADKRVKPRTDFVPGSLDVSKLKILEQPRHAASHTTKALMKAFQEALKVQESTPMYELGWYIHSNSADNIYQWIVELHSFAPEIPLYGDMKKAGLASIVLEMRFTNSFPFSPPFVRVIQPRFLPFQAGGGGHVTAGGAICMELLTNNGWLATNTIESVLLQIRMAMSSTDPKPARLQDASTNYGGGQSYHVGEAIEAYKRACMMHGWTVPEDFRDGSFLGQ